MKRLFVAILYVYCSGVLLAESATPWQRPLTRNDVLTISAGKFYLDGKPFAEISFNKFDLFWSLYGERLNGRELTPENPMVQAQDKALRTLRKLGFRSIRFFAFPWGEDAAGKVQDPGSRKIIFEALDKTVELCERNGIGVVWMLGCAQFTDAREHLKELCTDPQSANRKALYSYLQQVIDRYKGSPAVLMWEISNELTLAADIGENGVFNGKRVPTLREVAGFYNDVANVIKRNDPLRLVNNGGSNPREYQWNLYKKKGWTRDTFGEQRKCFELLFKNSAIDVIDIHYYPANMNGIVIAGANGMTKLLGLTDYMAIAGQLKKPLMIGETGRALVPADNKEFWKDEPGYFRSLSDAKTALPWINSLLDDIVNAGVPLSYWWAYQSDREMDRNDPLRMDVSIERNPEIVAAIAKANKRLKQKLGMPQQGRVCLPMHVWPGK